MPGEDTPTESMLPQDQKARRRLANGAEMSMQWEFTDYIDLAAIGESLTAWAHLLGEIDKTKHNNKREFAWDIVSVSRMKVNGKHYLEVGIRGVVARQAAAKRARGAE